MISSNFEIGLIFAKVGFSFRHLDLKLRYTLDTPRDGYTHPSIFLASSYQNILQIENRRAEFYNNNKLNLETTILRDIDCTPLLNFLGTISPAQNI